MKKVVIQEFPKDQRLWRVDWIDRVRWTSNVESVPEIQVFLTALKDDWVDEEVLKNSSLSTNQTRISISASYLPVVSIGSLWHKQECHSQDDFLSPRWAEVDTGQVVRTCLGGVVQIASTPVSPIPRNYYSVGNHFRDLADSEVLVISAKSKDFCYLVIPAIEMLRTYYMTSDITARYVLEDKYIEAFAAAKSGQNDNGDVFVHLRQNVGDDDAYLLGRWLCSEVMQKETKNLHQSLQIQTVNAMRSSKIPWLGSHIKIGFPFQGKTKLGVEGKRIQIKRPDGLNKNGVWAFLVTKISCCTMPMPYKNIYIGRDNDSRKGSNSEDPSLPANAYAGLQPSQTREEDELPFTSQQEPDKKRKKIKTGGFKSIFPDLINKPLNKNEKDVQKCKSAGFKYFSESLADNLGTGEGTHSYSKTGSASINEKNPFTNGIPSDIKTFIHVIRLMKKSPRTIGWSIKTLGLGGGYTLPNGEVLAHLPSRIKGRRNWHLMPTELARPRAVVIVEVANWSGTKYLLELERKATDKHSLVVLHTSDNAPIPSELLRLFLIEVCRKPGWPNPETLPLLIRTHIKHNPKKTAEEFCEKLISVLEGRAKNASDSQQDIEEANRSHEASEVG